MKQQQYPLSREADAATTLPALPRLRFFRAKSQLNDFYKIDFFLLTQHHRLNGALSAFAMSSDAMADAPDPPGDLSTTNSLHILTLNCWGLKYLSKFRAERLLEIGKTLAGYQPELDIVGLQECWTYSDYRAIRDATKSVLPYGKFYHSGVFGGGLVILSRFPIIESSMYRYPLNGRPTAFFRGDWFVGKGVACARLALPDGRKVEVFNTHLHAPYEQEPHDSYICHRTAQAWEIAKLMRAAKERGSLVVGLGDFNMVPMSFAHILVECRGGVQDVWRRLKPDSSIGACIDPAEAQRRKQLNLATVPLVEDSLHENGHTCDTIYNTWRWDEAHRKALEKGRDRIIAMSEQDPRAKRLDYIFFGSSELGWRVAHARVAMTERHPTLRCSLSDHFAVEATLVIEPVNMEKHTTLENESAAIEPPFYEEILAMINKYTQREREQRRWRMGHFVGQALFSIGSFVAVWWSTYNYVAFLLLLISTLGIMAGTLDGLIGGLFVGTELRALNEFEWEVRNALYLAGGPTPGEQEFRDWYD